MAAVPGTHTVTGGIATTSEMNTFFRDPLLFALNKPAAELRQAVLQAVATSTWTSVTFDIEEVDDDPSHTGGHSTSVNTSRFTAVYAGQYLLAGGVALALNATGQRGTRWAVNGTALMASDNWVTATAATAFSMVARVRRAYLNVGDYVELQVFQTSGVSLNTAVTGEDASSMSITWDRN